MRTTSGTSERLTDLRRVGQAPPENLLTLDGQRYMTPADAWTLLRTDIRGFLELQRAGRLLEHSESRTEHQRVSLDALRRLAGRCALFMHWYHANPGVALAAWDRTVQRMIEAFAEVMSSGRTTTATQDAVRAGMTLFAEERELTPRLSPTAATELAAREARIADGAEALLRRTEGFSGVTPKASEQVQALSRPFALWQTPDTLAADHIARMVVGAGQGQAVTQAGRKRLLETVPHPTAIERPMREEHTFEHAARERMPAEDDSVDPVIRWTIAEGGVRPIDLTTDDPYTFDRLLGFRGLVRQEGHTFAALSQQWMQENRDDVSEQSDPEGFFRELFFFMLAESRSEGALRTGVETVDPVVVGVILRGGLRPDTLRQLSEEEQRKVRRIPALVSDRGLSWLEQARAHYEDVEVHERLEGLPLDAVTVDDFIELFRYALDYTVVETDENDPDEESLPARHRRRRGEASHPTHLERCPSPGNRPARSACTCSKGDPSKERLPSSSSRVPRPDRVQVAKNAISTFLFVLTWPDSDEAPFYLTGITLLSDNDFEPEDLRDLAALEAGQTLYFGGGAAPLAAVRRLREDEPFGKAVRRPQDEGLRSARRPSAPSSRGATERCPAHGPGRSDKKLERCPAPGARQPSSSCRCRHEEGHERCPAPPSIRGRR